jgi:hypothetical protein
MVHKNLTESHFGRWRWTSFSFLISVVLALAVIPAFGQYGGKATVNGAVTDPSGAVIAGAEVTVANTLTGLTTKTTTVDNGTYVVPLLQVGTYSMTFAHPGFVSYTQTNIMLTADQVATVNATLKVGQVNQTVSVSANAQVLETGTAAMGQLISEQSVLELPLNGRNPASLVFLSTGVSNMLLSSAGINQSDADGNPEDTGASSGGGRQGSTYYMLDGVNSMDGANLLSGPMPNPDATQEFQVIQNNFQPQYGFAPGAIVSIVTKAGTNTWNGDAFEFLRNYALNAANPFTHTRDTLKRSQYGGSVGGPVKKDKFFVFGDIQETDEHTLHGVGATATVENNAELTGNFTDRLTGKMTNPCGTGGPANLNFDTGQIYQPNAQYPYGSPVVCTSGTNAGKTVNVKQPFVGNIIPMSMFDTVTTNFEVGMPKTNATNGLVYLPGAPQTDTTLEFTVRGDYNLGEKHRIFGRTFYNNYNLPANAGADVLASYSSWSSLYENWAGGYIWTISPNLVNSFGGAVNFMHGKSYPGAEINGKPFTYITLGATMTYPPSPPFAPSVNSLRTNGYTFGQDTNAPQFRRNIALSDSLNWVKGKHMVVFGADILRTNYEDSTDSNANPYMKFDGEVTGVDSADYDLGYPELFIQGGGEFEQNYMTNWSGFAQDSVRLKPNLTLNFGVRWEPYLAPTSYYGRAASWRSGQQSTRFPNAPLGLVFPGDKGVNGSTIDPTYSNFDPRLGIAWQPSFLKHTSVRAAVGVFSGLVPNADYHHVAYTEPFSPLFYLYYSQLGLVKADNPWASFPQTGGVDPFPNPYPWAASNILPTSNVQFITPFTLFLEYQPNFKNPKSFSWNTSVEHQFTNNLLLTVAYVGDETEHLNNGMENNPGVNNVRPNPNFNSMLIDSSNGTSSYNSFQISINKRMTHGLQFMSGFTFSKTLDSGTEIPTFLGGVGDPYNIHWNRGPSDVNFPVIWNSTWIWQEPRLNQLGKVGSQILGSWEFNGIYTVESGRPFSIVGGCNSSNNSGTLIDADRADVTGQPFNVHQGSKAQWLNAYFNSSAFQCNAVGTFGDSGRNLMNSPGGNNADLGVFKNFPIKEDRFRVQFRWEMFNAFNREWYGVPQTNPTSSTFGRITGLLTLQNPRIMQGAIKIYW